MEFLLSDVISRGNQRRCREMSTVFSGYPISYWPIFFSVPIVTVPEVFAKVNPAQFTSCFLKWQMTPAIFCSCDVFSKLRAMTEGRNKFPPKCVSATWPFQCYCLTTGSMVNKRKRKGGNLTSGNRSKISHNIDRGLPLMELTQPTLDDEHKAQVWNLFKCRLAPHVMVSPGVTESKAILDSGSHSADSGFQILFSGFFVSGTWIPDSKH